METLSSSNAVSFPDDSAEKGDEWSAKTASQSVSGDKGKRFSIQSSRVMFNYFLNFSSEHSLA
jgi:hypothetical protein